MRQKKTAVKAQRITANYNLLEKCSFDIDNSN